MLIHSANQVLTLTRSPQRGSDLGHLGIIPDGSILIKNDEISAIGASSALMAKYSDEPRFNASGKIVMPGFVDPHTHALWVGDRSTEFEMRIQGKSYLEILSAGGGILSTVRATRQATVEQMIAETRPRLEAMFTHGTTTAEVKSGYGLETLSELRMLDAIMTLDEEGPVELVSTFLGAHAIAPEFDHDSGGYTDVICTDMLPKLLAWSEERYPGRSKPFVDVFCETGAFSLKQSRQILTTARKLGFPLKIHADEFDNLGGSSLAADLNATSADHLVATTAEDITHLAKSDTVAVALPCTPFGLAEFHYTPAQAILEAGGLLALATDLNPGTAWCENMQFAIALACRYLRLTPAQAIAAATINAAAAIGRADRIGSLDVGKQADILILNVPDYRHIGYRFGTNLVQTVIKHGKVHQLNLP